MGFFDVTAPAPLPASIQKKMQDDPRYAMAQALSQQGMDASPARTPWVGAARVAQALLGAYSQNKLQGEYGKRGEAYNKTLAEALAAMRGTQGTGIVAEQPPAPPTPIGVIDERGATGQTQDLTQMPMDQLGDINVRAPAPPTPPGAPTQTAPTAPQPVAPEAPAQPMNPYQAMAAVLARNPDTADMGYDVQMKAIAAEIEAQQQAAKEAAQERRDEFKAAAQQARDDARYDQMSKQQQAQFDQQLKVVGMQQYGMNERTAQMIAAQDARAYNNQPLEIIPDGEGGWKYGTRSEARGKAAPAPAGGKLTEDQSKTVLYSNRMIQANKRLNELEWGGYDPSNTKERAATHAPMGLGNKYISKEGQQYIQGAREFLSGVLRKDTGAAVTKTEFDTYYPTYFPVYGDSAEVIKQKAEARANAIENLRSGAGQAANMIPQQSTFDDYFRELPSGAEFTAPDGTRRRKP